MAYGFSIDNIHIEDTCLSDHLPIVFDVPLCPAKTPGYYSHYINSLSSKQFAEAYQKNAIVTLISSAAELLSSPDNLISHLHSSCSDILDAVANISEQEEYIEITQAVGWFDPFSQKGLPESWAERE